MILTRYCRTNPFVLGICACTFVLNVCFAENLMQSRRRIDNYYAAVGDDGFGGQAFGGAVELQRLMPRDALPVFRLAGPARKTSLFKRALLGPRNSDDDKECDSEHCFLTTHTCCRNGCMPVGAECCSSASSVEDDDDADDLYCEQGFRCGIFKNEVKCCRDPTCSREKEAEEREEAESRATTRLSTQGSGFTTTTIITPTPPTVTLTTPALLPPVMPPSSSSSSSSSSITSPLVTSIVPSSTTTSQATIMTTATTSSEGAAIGSRSSSTGGGDVAAGAGAVAMGLANRRVDPLRVEGIMMLGLVGGCFHAFF